MRRPTNNHGHIPTEEDEGGDAAAVVASKLGVMVAAGHKGGGRRERQREAERAGDSDFAFVGGVHTTSGVVFCC